MKLFRVLLIPALVFLAGCVTTVEVNHYPNASRPQPAGFLSDSEKWQRVRDRLGSVQVLSRGEILQGTSHANTAGVVQQQLGYGWVCRQRSQAGVTVVVYCARGHKLQRHVRRNDEPAFIMRLQPFLSHGAAPVYLDRGWR